MSFSCHTCPAVDEDLFYRYNKSTCKACLLKRNREWRKANRNSYIDYQQKYQGARGRSLRSKRFEWLDAIKADPSTKKFAVSAGVVSGRSVEAVEDEIAKCRLICANCHRIRTARQQRRRGAR